jgi:Flp pilus assembly protein CpaB
MSTATQIPPTRGPQGPGAPGEPPKSGPSGLLWSRRGAIVVAVVAGLAALAVLLVFMANYRSSVRDESASTRVLVATRDIDSGTAGEAIAEAGLYRETDVRGDEAAAGAFAGVEGMLGKHTTATIHKGQQLTADDFATGSDPIAGKLSGVQRALSVPVDTAHGNIGQVKAGSQVEVLGSFSSEPLSGHAGAFVVVLARDALVLSAPSTSSSGVGASKEQQVVLRVSDVQATRIADAADQGHVWLAIRPPTLSKDSSGGAVAEGGGQ